MFTVTTIFVDKRHYSGIKQLQIVWIWQIYHTYNETKTPVCSVGVLMLSDTQWAICEFKYINNYPTTTTAAAATVLINWEKQILTVPLIIWLHSFKIYSVVFGGEKVHLQHQTFILFSFPCIRNFVCHCIIYEAPPTLPCFFLVCLLYYFVYLGEKNMVQYIKWQQNGISPHYQARIE